MPEIKNTFIRSKMNKDLDSRLVPNGEYRDAMNIQVSTSEESDVGTIQNVLGNNTCCIGLSTIGDNLKDETSLKCIIIKGSAGTFSSGIDITSFASLASDKQLLNSIMAPLDGVSYNQIQKSCLIWQEISIPVIAVLEGPVFGAGLQLALGADIRIAGDNTVLSIMETKYLTS